MVAYTFEKAFALGIGIGPELEDYQDGYGHDMSIGYINGYVTYWWSGFYVPEMANFALYGIVGLIVFVGALRNFAHKFMTGRLPKPLRPAQTWITKHLFLSSTVGTQALEPVSFIGARGKLGRWTSFHIPPRVHGILAGGYVFFNLLLLVTPYRATKPSFIFPSIGYNFELYARNFSDRTGIMSFGATPLVYILASRNNPISFLTGASYSTLQIYHRWVGRMVFMHALFHSAGWTILEAAYSDEEILSQFAYPYWNWGCAATAMGALLCAFSIRRFRELSYEIFLIGHIIANVFWIVGCYYHVYFIGEDVWRYLHYIYAAVGIWAGERLIRLVSMLFINAWHFGRRSSSDNKNSTSASDGKKGYLAAEGYLVGTGDYIRLRVTPSHSWPKMMGRGGPGSHVFISSPSFKIYENHPFTIAWPSHMPSSSPASTPHSSNGSDSSHKDLPLSDTSSDPVAAFEHTEIENEHTFELILKSYSGYTKRLADSLAAPGVDHNDGGSAHPVKPLRLIVEGPYGQGTRLEGYESIILIAGGSGISATTAHLADLAKHAHLPAYKVQRITLIWAVRQTGAVAVLLPYLLRLQTLLPPTLLANLTISIHYTGDTRATPHHSHSHSHSPSNSFDDLESKETLHSAALSSIRSHFKVLDPALNVEVIVQHGRPDVGGFVDTELAQRDAMGRVAVSACGPSGLCDRTREAVKARLGGTGRGETKKQRRRVESDELVYHEEAFTW